MSIDMIKKIIPPPAVINEKITTDWGRLESELGIQLSNDYKNLIDDYNGVNDWGKAESRLGILLPEDYKSFIDEYGIGRINGFLWIFSPFVDNPYINLIEQAKEINSALAEVKLHGEKFPYNFFPSEDGVLPFGITDSGEVLFWKLEKNCNWKIVINESRGPLCDEFDLGWAEFMVELLSARLESLVLPKKEFARVADFKSLTDI
ncbi:TPA: hypothetical protein HIT55_004487 [Escherichia fergusonii]|uniref:SMI1/KNR4 family protein n=1 Tax=Escherichia fergusonii TaxID=564 RepID=UPI000CF30083|nr:SMI1/KNR4 family protein [Escherichia fergusonii]MCP9676881.1 SMI1/KNR4 family protein [Escherichia fergusonii]MCP9695295.1 SMI1/KNR4 family protein [Escherichia fergusonii]PQI94291.1 hypothetical protein C5U38_21985 [Escherichia fergusonii]QMG48286.1 SMI1/KNR4 family protein [Escherichia fergusonii]URA04386.1 SMI1/KNR4 family protein [Escherichia fergusonii]